MIATASKTIAGGHNVMNYLTRFIALTLLCFGSVPSIAYAGANLLVTPTRIVFEERMRTAQVTVMNAGTETGNFRFSFIRQHMTESGKFLAVEDGEEGMFSDSMIRYSPRQVTLPPGQSQVIRLMLRKPRDLKDGEYRSHMVFQVLPKPRKSNIDSAIKANQKGITVEILPIVGISIPVIVRQGQLSSETSLSNLQYIAGTEANPRARIGIDIHRSGNASIYGDFRATFTPKGGKPVVVGLSNGVAVYSNSPMRHFEIPMNAPPELELANGELRIVFLESGKDEKTGLIAEIALAI